MASYNDIGERFERYASIYTQSKDGCDYTPSTPCQRDLASLLAQELQEMGASNVFYDETNCYVYAEIPGNLPVSDDDRKSLKGRADTEMKRRENLAPVLGLMAHMDTSDAVDSSHISPRRVRNYDGGEIPLGDGTYTLSPEKFPSLKKHIGSDLIVTDGTSVLGGDDKAGVAAIMETAAFLLRHPEYAHGTVRICFTPDEEVGNGPRNLDQSRFACDYAYTVDGGDLGEFSYENFNAASAAVIIHGISTHPGSAYGVMRNSLLVAQEFASMLPAMETPFHTREREGFYHLEEVQGTTDETHMTVLIRDHSRDRFEERKNYVQKIADTLNKRYGEGTIDLTVKDSYFNMKEKIEPHPQLIDIPLTSMKKIGITPLVVPIRGGTDGCILSFRGIPCPNLGTGAYNYHSRYEYVSVREMEANVKLLVRILNAFAEYRIDD